MRETMVKCGKLISAQQDGGSASGGDEAIYGDTAATALTSINNLRDVSAVHHHGWNNGLSCVQSTPPIHDDKAWTGPAGDMEQYLKLIRDIKKMQLPCW